MLATAFATVSASAYVAYTVYALYFDWDNNFNNAAITWSSTAAGKMTASFNFTDWNHGYPATIRGCALLWLESRQ